MPEVSSSALVTAPSRSPSESAVDTVIVDTGERRYEIRIGRGLLARTNPWEGLPTGKRAFIVTNTTVRPLWEACVLRSLQAHGFREVQTIVLPDGEAHKDWQTLNTIFDALLRDGADRRAWLFALGGGVVGDMTGFAAGCYQRGIPFVQVPTTLLAQVDSSVGGKTAINHPLGKNMIGLFNQPERVLCDLDTLDTLPERELIAGLAEVIKYGPIADAAFLDWCEAHIDALRSRDEAALRHAIRRSCEIKAEVVGADEREAGLREILNFGHTFGHAIETGCGYGVWLHGEAVGCGMAIAARLSAGLGLIDERQADRLVALIARAGLPVTPPQWPLAQWLELMQRDKKTRDGDVRFVLLDGIGRCVMRTAPAEAVQAAIRQQEAG